MSQFIKQWGESKKRPLAGTFVEMKKDNGIIYP